MTTNEKQCLKNKLITINLLSIICILISFLSIISGIGFLTSFIQWISQNTTNPEPNVPSDVDIFFTSSLFKWFIFAIVMSVMMFISFILNLVASIIILSTDWKNQQIDDKKLLWGLLAIFLLGFIALLIFSISSMKILKNYKEPENNPEYQLKG